MEPRERILDAAATLYAEGGFRGTTTRRVAQEAGVNEITLFRHFGTKEALIRAALEQAHRDNSPAPLGPPEDPPEQLYQWAFGTFQHWHKNRDLICRVMGDLVEHPEIAPGVCEQPEHEHHQLATYLKAMRARGWTTVEFDADGAAGLLMGALFTHAVWRDHWPQVAPADMVIRQFVELLLRAVGSTILAGGPAPRPE
jgi:AcrR family transcriptional regulator